ncbi:lipoprotein [Devosia sp.]|uniref:lipoprotein n=1 Tax=Devosia sp. TaxID=1871048 RepID=UPI003BAB9303
MRKTIIALLAVLTLAACSSIPIGTVARLRALDYLNDDLASLLVAFDVPLSLEPIPNASALNFDIATPSSGERHIRAMLAETDPGDLAGTLQPPADGRNYYLFGFSPADKAAIREAQAWAKTLPPGANTVTLSLSPDFCRTAQIDPAKVTVSVLVALPGTPNLAPLISNQPLKTLLATAPAKDIPSCAGHSG